ncbi:MAG: hypothetical protein J7J16_02430 [Deltaproteobacteria bacterium]|nr:hypothetical protein [Deltaproteobacteria bacterium]
MQLKVTEREYDLPKKMEHLPILADGFNSCIRQLLLQEKTDGIGKLSVKLAKE